MVKTTERVKRIISTFIKNLKNRNIPIWKIIFYGSYINRRKSKHSDIDLAVISPYFEKKDIFDRLVILGRLRINIKEPIEPIGYTINEYNNCEKGSFLDEIKHTGKIIYSNPKIK